MERLFDTTGEFHLVRGQGEQMLCEGSATLVDYRQRAVMQMNAREITGAQENGAAVAASGKTFGPRAIGGPVSHTN